MTAEEINKVLADAQVSAADPGAKTWLWAILGLIVIMGIGGLGRGKIKGFARHVGARYRAYSARRFARRHSRRGRRR